MRRLLTSIASFVSWHRRAVGAILAAGAVLLLATALRTPTPTTAVVVTASDLPAGHTLTSADLTVGQLPPGAVPADAVLSPSDIEGRTTAVPLSAGTILQPGLLGGDHSTAEGSAVVPILVADEGLRAMLRPGDTVSLVAPGPEGLIVVASGARVVALPEAEQAGSQVALASGRQSELILVEVPEAEAGEVASLGQAGEMSVVLGSL